MSQESPHDDESSPLTLGTAGHIDHGKTALVRALTGVNTDRLPAEQERGMTIELGFASFRLSGGRVVSVIDVPGHERFVRAMVSGATGIDLYLMAIAADDGVMPQTEEHAAVLRVLGVSTGVVAITKVDVRDPSLAMAQARELMPDAEIVSCSVRTGEGIAALSEALARAARIVSPRAQAVEAETPRTESRVPALLHIDRVFTITGAGTVVTGTLWAGAIRRGDRLTVLPSDRVVRVRGVQVHDADVEAAVAGQRVAVNLAGVSVTSVSRGDALAGAGSQAYASQILDVSLEISDPLPPSSVRVQVHHGTRDVPARLIQLSSRYAQLRLERPLLARSGDRFVLRRIAPPGTLGGGTVLDPSARRHGARADVLERLGRIDRGESDRAAVAQSEAPEPSGHSDLKAPTLIEAEAQALATRLKAAGHEPPSLTELGADAVHVPALRDAGIAVRIGRDMYAHRDAMSDVRDEVVRIIEREGSITLARLRDELQTSRKFAQALLEHLDSDRVTRRLPDDSRVLRRK